MPNSKNIRERIKPRQTVGGLGPGNINVAASPHGGMGSSSSDVVVFQPGRRTGSSREARLYQALSPTFAGIGEIIRQMAAANQPKVETPAEQLARHRQESIDRIAGSTQGSRLANQAEVKTRSGEWTQNEVAGQIASTYSAAGASGAYLEAARPFAERALETADENVLENQLREQQSAFREVAKKGFDEIHAGYDPERPEDYAEQRSAIFDARHDLDIDGWEIDEIEMASLTEQIRKLSITNPIKAYDLLSLAERARPDGTPGIADVLPDGRERLAALRSLTTENLAANVERFDRAAKEEYQTSTRGLYEATLGELAKLNSPDAVAAWEAAHFSRYSMGDLQRGYGPYLWAARSAIQAAYENATVSDPAVEAEWNDAIQRGVAGWDDIDLDQRLSPKQKITLFSRIKEQAVRQQQGHIPDKVFAGVFEDPFQQNEAYRRLEEVDSKLPPDQANKARRRIVEDIKQETTAGKLKPIEKPPEPEPPMFLPQSPLKNPQAPPEEPKLSDAGIQKLGTLFAAAGSQGIEDVTGIDLYSINASDRGKVLSAAQASRIRTLLQENS